MSPALNSVIEITRYPENSPTNAKTSMLDHSISRNSSTTGAAFNNLINICVAVILIAILTFLEAVPGMPLQPPAQSKAVER